MLNTRKLEKLNTGVDELRRTVGSYRKKLSEVKAATSKKEKLSKAKEVIKGDE